MQPLAYTLFLTSLLLCAASCSEPSDESATPAGTAETTPSSDAPSGATKEEGGHDHAHTEVDLDPVTIGEWTVALAQGHGNVAAGVEGHLVVKLPFNDNGATIVRAWIGGEDRTQSMVGRGIYAPSHDDYDIHAMAPDTLPEETMWWIEIETPDGKKVVGSATPILE